MTELAQALVGGILIGGLYVAISIGFSMSFGVLDVVDLAVGMWVVLGAFAVIVASEKLGVDAFLLLPVIFIVFAIVGWLIAPLIYRVRTSKYALPALMGLAFTFGLATVIRGGLLTAFGYTPRAVQTQFFSGNITLFGITAPAIRVAGFAFALIATGLFLAFLFYTRTEPFADGIDQLIAESRRRRTAMMCSESVWWRCHRRIVADVAVVKFDVPVAHLMHSGRRNGRLVAHEPSEAAHLRADGHVVWN